MRQAGLPLLLKRATDLGLASAALVATAPLMAGTAIAVRVGIGSPVLFRQPRPGLHGVPFTVFKFRTMTDERGPDGELLPDVDRLPALGRWIRRMSLDELPQLLNVLRGELSLVGPRPLLMQYLELYSPDEMRRHEVLPGITGWTQVTGRNALSWREKFERDVWYVDNWSPWLDARILWKTLTVITGGRGVSRQGHPTMPVWRGHERDAASEPTA